MGGATANFYCYNYFKLIKLYLCYREWKLIVANCNDKEILKLRRQCLMDLILFCEFKTLCRHQIIKDYFVQEKINNNITDWRCEENCDNCQQQIDNEIQVDVLSEFK